MVQCAFLTMRDWWSWRYPRRARRSLELAHNWETMLLDMTPDFRAFEKSAILEPVYIMDEKERLMNEGESRIKVDSNWSKQKT